MSMKGKHILNIQRPTEVCPLRSTVSACTFVVWLDLTLCAPPIRRTVIATSLTGRVSISVGQQHLSTAVHAAFKTGTMVQDRKTIILFKVKHPKAVQASAKKVLQKVVQSSG